jgi:mannose/fructose/N-acetylgalactosamine-specific phosphotransferase system component IID
MYTVYGIIRMFFILCAYVLCCILCVLLSAAVCTALATPIHRECTTVLFIVFIVLYNTVVYSSYYYYTTINYNSVSGLLLVDRLSELV